jgi:hypothetical protein
MAKRESQPDPNAGQTQSHDPDREKLQPYAKELEDYGHGVVNPPEERIGKQESVARPRKR